MPKLKAPSKAQRAAGLPTSKAEAVKAGLTRFIPEDGVERIIRKYGTEKYPVGTVETAASRKGNRGGGTDGSRAINEQLATPKGADKKSFGKAMADANAQGMDGDHIREVSRTAEGIRYKETSGRGTRLEFHDNYEKAGVAVGNQAGNVQALDPDINQRVKPAQLRAMDNGIAAAKGSYNGLVFSNGLVKYTTKFGALLPVLGIGFDILDANGKIAKANSPNANALDKFQAGVAATTVATAAIPEPAAQVINFGSGVVNLTIDVARDLASMTHGNAIRGRNGAKRAQKAIQNASPST